MKQNTKIILAVLAVLALLVFLFGLDIVDFILMLIGVGAGYWIAQNKEKIRKYGVRRGRY